MLLPTYLEYENHHVSGIILRTSSSFLRIFKKKVADGCDARSALALSRLQQENIESSLAKL